ncbi:hypothetical protein JTE90_012472 [Oedothorax gibbosus]|uniref:Uncharacterized protein n=1 Tax=Oedothorax gibbosus TaxID=931172 RepID=A0AAV6UD35_9ARAC|nr:hypothetical protein JTE90_012472 [Oedothorax gibbosus]
MQKSRPTRRRLSQGPIGEGSAGAAAAAVYYFRPRGHSVVFVLTCLYPNGVLLRFYFGLRHLAWRFASQVRTPATLLEGVLLKAVEAVI